MSSYRPSAAVLACVLWALCGLYGSQFVYRGWLPHDEGTVGQSAQRVLDGELPHRDFDDVYTGGLTYLNALGMRVFGVNLRAPRLVLFAFYMAFLAAAYGVARRIASPRVALLAMALAAVWSAPNYFVSLPSWYNLYFATFGTLALLRHLDSNRRHWLVVAGVCGGLSILAKISGVFYVAGALLFLMYVEQNRTLTGSADRARRSWFSLLSAIPTLFCLAVIVGLASSAAVAPALLQLLVPPMVVCAFVTWNEWRQDAGAAAIRRARRLWSTAWPFVLGATAPILALVLFYWSQDAVADLIRGVIILPQRRLSGATANPPPLATLALAIPLGWMILAGRRRPLPREGAIAIAAAVVLGAALFFGSEAFVNSLVSVVSRSMTIVAAVTGVWLLAASAAEPRGDIADAGRSRLFLIVTMAAMVALVQFPYATATYFFYAAPMSILAICALVSAQPAAPRQVHLAVGIFALLFAAIFMNRTYAGDRDVRSAFVPYRAEGLLDVERGGLWVPASDKGTYEEVVRLVQRHATGGTIFAGPDCPEVYFLSGFRNPTRAVFDFLSPVAEDAEWMTGLLSHAPIRAAVINTDPRFSPRLDPAVQKVLERRFPSAIQVGRFVVRFKQ